MTALRRYFAVTWSPRTWRAIAYGMVSLPIAALLFTYVATMYAVGISLVIVWIGVVILAFAQWSLRGIGSFERSMANSLIDAGVDAPGPRGYRIHAPGGTPGLADWGRWGHALLHDSTSWRALAWLAMRIVLAPVGFALAVCAVVVPLALVGAWLTALGHVTGLLPGPPPDEHTASKVVDIATFWTLVGTPVIAAAVPMFAWVNHHYASLNAVLARWALGPCADERVAQATERAELAETQVRIDQELHDSIGHMITMNIVQAGAGAHVFDSDPDFARQALRNIEERGRVAMGELDRIIAAIRGDDAEPRAPLPTLSDLPGLVDQARAAGLTIEARLEAAEVAAPLSRAAYAIVREGVTNAAKHAPGAVIHVHTATLGDALAIAVSNGPADAGAEPIAALTHARAGLRHGIAGIRDRAALLGGSSIVGSDGSGGFEVMVLIPLELGLGGPSPDEDDRCCRWSRVRAKVDA